MKKVLFALAIVMTMGFCANAQTDSWFQSSNNENMDRTGGLGMPGLPGGHGYTDDQDATPLGSGLLILTAMGAGYALRKRNA